MAEIIEQDEEVVLEEGEELGSLDDLAAGTPVVEEEPQAVEEEEVEEVHIPEKFKGKSIEDVIRAYEEAEKALGRKNNEVGELRKLTDEFLKQSLQLNETPSAAAEGSKIEVDDLLEDPNKALETALNSSPRLRQLEEQLIAAQRVEQQKQFEAKHPGGMEQIVSPEVQNWIAASNVRQRLFMEAHQNYDYDLAGELLEMYNREQGVKVQGAQEKQKANRDKALKEGAVEKGGTGQAPKKIFKRTDLMKMMMTNRDAYDDPAFQAELTKAYQENRVR